MVEEIIEDIPVNFPFKPYDVQNAFMTKVIASLNSGTNAVLESPTGTGKTLSLLCSTLAWVTVQKKNLQTQLLKPQSSNNQKISSMCSDFDSSNAQKIFTKDNSEKIKVTSGGGRNWMVPKIIYASRTHSQLTQAVQEMKRTAYSFMKAAVLGSRDQLCIHPEVSQETNNSSKVQMCKIRVTSRQCTFYSRIESNKTHPDLHEQPIMDIEDLVSVGRKLKMCPYYASKELISDADIIFMPYNYLLDPSVRKGNKIELAGNIIILDEAHNIEKICEEYTSTQIKSSDLGMAIEDATHIMKVMSSSMTDIQDDDHDTKDFTIDDVAHFKEVLLKLEKVIDDIKIENEPEGISYPASFLYTVLEQANINYVSYKSILAFSEKLVQYSAMESQQSNIRKGGSFQKLADFLSIVFIGKEEAIEKVYKCFKVHVEIEEISQTHKRKDDFSKTGWLSKNVSKVTNKKQGRIINYWCFNPGFGMEQLLNSRVRSIILTSGTLAPMKPFIEELSLPVHQQLENPHIISSSQVFVKIISNGPDREPLISNYQNRDNPKYINSLGSTILNVARIVPDGLLVFFPSYPMLNQCVNSWQSSGLWADLMRFKPIFIEPRGKNNFNCVIQDFYESIKNSKGGCFLAVCRGKVSEGLDFVDSNGRAVIITGLPFPPLKDPKIMLKKKYLDENRSKQNELLTGQAWYALEATRAVNQAIGRVIRHRHDYGAILLCDMRFQQTAQIQQLSKWVRNILCENSKQCSFGSVIKDLRNFFKTTKPVIPKLIKPDNSKESKESATAIVPKAATLKTKNILPCNELIDIDKSNAFETWSPHQYASATGHLNVNKLPSAMDFMNRLNGNLSAIDFNCSKNACVSECEGKRERSSPEDKTSIQNTSACSTNKRKKYKLTQLININTSDFKEDNTQNDESEISEDKSKVVPENRIEFLKILRETLSPEAFADFTDGLIAYKNDHKIDALIDLLLKIFKDPTLLHLLQAIRRFVKREHRERFDERLILK